MVLTRTFSATIFYSSNTRMLFFSSTMSETNGVFTGPLVEQKDVWVSSSSTTILRSINNAFPLRSFNVSFLFNQLVRPSCINSSDNSEANSAFHLNITAISRFNPLPPNATPWQPKKVQFTHRLPVAGIS